MMYYAYALWSESQSKTYVGHTSDLNQRLNEHIHGRSDATKYCKDWLLIYNERFSTRSLAMRREKFLKTGRSREILKKYLEKNFSGAVA